MEIIGEALATPPDITIRPERPDDFADVARAVMRAYAAIPYSDLREHVMVERLRACDAYVPDLSMIAEVDGAVVGHIMLTMATIGCDGGAATTLALAPLSVVPDRQRSGIGSRLVRAAHARAAELGFESIVLVGIPGSYERFGYQPLGPFPITLPFDAPTGSCLILPLRPGALDGVNGQVRYAGAWLNH